MMICMEFELNIDLFFDFQLENRIVKLNFESSSKIDDLIITTDHDLKIYLQMKRNISYSCEKDSEFYSVCEQFVNQYILNYKNDYAYVLATRSQSSKSVTLKLKRLLEGIRLARNLEIHDDLNDDEKEFLNKLISTFQSIYNNKTNEMLSENKTVELLSRMYVEIFDIEGGEVFEKYINIILQSRINVNVHLFWRMLISLAIQYGSNRRCLSKEYLHEQLTLYLNKKDITAEQSIEIIWDDNNTEVEIQKDYILARGSHELTKQADDTEEKDTVFIIEIYRFSEHEKKNIRYTIPNKIELENGLVFEVIFRCSSQARLEEFINSERITDYIGDNAEIIIIPAKGKIQENDIEKAYGDILKKKIKNTNSIKCINCGKAIFQEEAYIVEIDNEECKAEAGIIHKECLRPIDRVLGVTKSNPDNDQYSFLKNFDINLWIKLALKGQFAWGGLNNIPQDIAPLVIDTDEIFMNGRFCVRTFLKNGMVRYATHRGVIHRMSKKNAEEFAQHLNIRYKDAEKEKNPICYSGETFVSGSYNNLLTLVGQKEEIIECVNAEVAIYNDAIANMYNECDNFYAPVIYLSIEGEPVIINGIFPVITNPLDLNIYLTNWSNAGITISNYEVNIIIDDNDFMLKMLSLIINGIRPVVNMIIGKDQKIIKGYIITTMHEIKNEQSEDNLH